MSIDLKITVGQRQPFEITGVKFECPCDVCGATGYLARRGPSFQPEIKHCTHCNGKGVWLTAAGRDFLDFLERHRRDA